MENGKLLHIEFQTTTDPQLPLYMLECYAGLYRMYGAAPMQLVLCVGNDELTMSGVWEQPGLRDEYMLVDVRTLDGEELLRSDSIGDKLLAMLCEQPEVRERVRRILTSVNRLEPEAREKALRMVLTLSMIRGAVSETMEAAKRMGVNIDITEDPFIRELAEKRHDEGRQEASARLLRKALNKRFGIIPERIEERIAAATADEMDEARERIFEADSIREVFRRRH